MDNLPIDHLKDILLRYKLPLSIALGTIFLLGGIYITSSDLLGGAKVEVIDNNVAGSTSSSQISEQKIVVEISGQVTVPGVYELLAGERVERLLIMAGGLTAKADRAWVEKNINRAAKLMDGQKYYIPKIGESVQGLTLNSSTGSMGQVNGAQTSLININTALLSELDKLVGIGSARAQAIIDARPFTSIEELHTKKVIPKSVFEKIKDQISI